MRLHVLHERQCEINNLVSTGNPGEKKCELSGYEKFDVPVFISVDLLVQLL